MHTRGWVLVSDCSLVPVVCTGIPLRERAMGVVGHREWPSRKGVELTESNGGGCEDVKRFENPGVDDGQPILSLPCMEGGHCGVQACR